jgi:hypothetical protein
VHVCVHVYVCVGGDRTEQVGGGLGDLQDSQEGVHRDSRGGRLDTRTCVCDFSLYVLTQLLFSALAIILPLLHYLSAMLRPFIPLEQPKILPLTSLLILFFLRILGRALFPPCHENLSSSKNITIIRYHWL